MSKLKEILTKKIGRPKGTTVNRKPIDEEDFFKLINYIDNKEIKKQPKNNLKKAFYLLFFFGFRVNELLTLRNSDILQAVEENKILLPNNTKTKKAREAFISVLNASLLKEIFSENIKEPKDYYIFSPLSYQRYDSYSSSSFKFLLNTMIKDSLGKQYTSHSFRAGYITRLHRKGVSARIIQEIISHRNISTTMGYISIEEQELTNAVSLL